MALTRGSCLPSVLGLNLVFDLTTIRSVSSFVCCSFGLSSFLRADWEKDEEDAEDAQAWGQDWDDEANDDGFVKQLRTELAAHAAQ